MNPPKKGQPKSVENRLRKAMIDLVNEQGETHRVVQQLGRTVDRFIRSLEGRGGNGNGRRK